MSERETTTTELTGAEQTLIDCYEQLVRVLRDERDHLDPFEERGAIKALAVLWQVVNGLDREPGQIYDVEG